MPLGRLPTLILVASLTGTAAAQEQRFDFYGDPLPPGAVARMGSIRLKHKQIVREILFTSDGKTLLTCGEDGVRAWEGPSGRQRWQTSCVTPAEPITAMLLAPSSHMLLPITMPPSRSLKTVSRTLCRRTAPLMPMDRCAASLPGLRLSRLLASLRQARA